MIFYHSLSLFKEKKKKEIYKERKREKDSLLFYIDSAMCLMSTINSKSIKQIPEEPLGPSGMVALLEADCLHSEILLH